MKTLFLFLASFISTVLSKENSKAIANIKQTYKGQIRGKVVFKEGHQGVLITGLIKGLTPGFHGLHIHQGKCGNVGDHFNPQHVLHGGQDKNLKGRGHVGDLGNIVADHRGIAMFQLWDEVVSLDPESENYVVGRSVAVHDDMDDLGLGHRKDSLKNGNSGNVIGCGMIIQNAASGGANEVKKKRNKGKNPELSKIINSFNSFNNLRQGYFDDSLHYHDMYENEANPDGSKESNNEESNNKESNNDGSNNEGSNNEGSNDDRNNNEGSKTKGSNNEGANNDGANSEGANSELTKSEGSVNKETNSDGANTNKTTDKTTNKGEDSEGTGNNDTNSEGINNEGKTNAGTNNKVTNSMSRNNTTSSKNNTTKNNTNYNNSSGTKGDWKHDIGKKNAQI